MYPGIIQIELAKLILKGRAHTGKFLKSLEEKGFITRNPANQGSKIIMESAITPSGMELYKKITDALDEHIKEANECLNIDVESVIRNLKLIRQSAMEKYNIKFN